MKKIILLSLACFLSLNFNVAIAKKVKQNEPELTAEKRTASMKSLMTKCLQQIVNDPNSLQVRNIEDGKSFFLTEFNSKNGFGGYGEWNSAKIVPTENFIWEIYVSGVFTNSCDMSYLKQHM